MRILVHDFSGHPFQVQLSRALARRGHVVRHVYCSSYTTGRGLLETTAEDPDDLTIEDVALDGEFAKYSPVHRLRQEARYARLFVERVDRFRPDVVLESNDPLLSKTLIARRLRSRDVPWVFWLQDLYSVAIAGEAERRLGAAGRLAGRLPLALEGQLARRAGGVVPITSDFDAHLDRWKVPADRRRVIPNWAPVDELVPRVGRRWADAQGIPAGPVVLYAGTLGLKHDPAVLVELARILEPAGAQVVVVSEGAGADLVAAEGGDRPNLHVRPFQPYTELPDVLGSADVLLTILNDEAGVFSVPSKLLSYLCAGRPIVAAVPEVNLSARILEETQAGRVVRPSDAAAMAQAVQGYLDDPEVAAEAGRRARRHAEEHFDIDVIAGRFDEVLAAATGDVRLVPRERAGSHEG